jgi:hypothetical protein|tara:strand:+ start:806 stop:973 length:168 start_codon:yes stop_codon:yes gene_type:complete
MTTKEIILKSTLFKELTSLFPNNKEEILKVIEENTINDWESNCSQPYERVYIDLD